MKNLIITGGAGFIGSSLVDRIVKTQPQSKIIILDNFNNFYEPKWKRAYIAGAMATAGDRIGVLEMDVAAEPSELAGEISKHASRRSKDFIGEEWTMVHLAANAGVRPSTQFPAQFARTNALGTMSILEAARLLKIKKIVNASSSSVYGRRSTVPFSENDAITHPQSPYAATKIAAEIFCENYAILNQMQCASLRFFTVYGPRQRPDLAIHQFARKILNDETITVFGDGSTSRDYTYIDDILDGITGAIAWINKPDNGDAGFHRPINLGSHRPITLTEMIETIETALGKKAKIKREDIPSADVITTYANVSLAEKLFHYEPKVPFATGIAQFCKWLKEWK